jgi:hypothetical protein
MASPIHKHASPKKAPKGGLASDLDYESGRKEREAMRTAHDRERDDLNSSHRDAHRKMGVRHENAIKELHARFGLTKKA